MIITFRVQRNNDYIELVAIISQSLYYDSIVPSFGVHQLLLGCLCRLTSAAVARGRQSLGPLFPLTLKSPSAEKHVRST